MESRWVLNRYLSIYVYKEEINLVYPFTEGKRKWYNRNSSNRCSLCWTIIVTCAKATPQSWTRMISRSSWGALHEFRKSRNRVLKMESSLQSCGTFRVISNHWLVHISSKIVPENTNSKLVPERVYKENRANWNANYLPDNLRQSNGNWVLPAWNEPTAINWNQLQANIKNGRKASGKQHYFSVARYIAGPNASLSSRYRMFRHLLNRALTLLIILGCTLLCCLTWEIIFCKRFMCLIEYLF